MERLQCRWCVDRVARSVHRLFSADQALSTRKRLKDPVRIEPTSPVGVISPGGQRRRAVRALSYIVAFVLVLAAPSSAGSAERDMPGIGTFAYNGSPVLAPASSRMMAAVNIDH
jgi:hypothetical protein